MYKCFYSLWEQPFVLTPDPRFLHLAAAHQEALVTLVGGVKLRKGIIPFHPGLSISWQARRSLIRPWFWR
jgi:hypothetical protein